MSQPSRPRFRKFVLLPGAMVAVAATSLGGLTVATAAPSDTTGLNFLAPFYIEADLTGDDAVDEVDIAKIMAALGSTSADPAWSGVSAADFDGNETITLTDVAQLSQRALYDDGPFSAVEASTIDAQKAMNAGVISAVSLTKMYLDRIAAYDDQGEKLNSIISVNEHALEIAAQLDAERAAGGPRSMLHGIPVIAKDNYNTVDMPTTAGCTCLKNNQTDADSQMVEQMRADGAVILAKANLDEFAFNLSTDSSLGGPTMSPYVRNQNAGGSSGGTGASIAANLGIIGLGTDTGGSIRVPSSFNQLVGVRPTVGLASRDGIIPLALSQDTGGPMTRTVADAAIALDSVVGFDPEDAITAESTGNIPGTYTSSLDDSSLEGARIGYVPSIVGTNPAVLRLFNQAKADLEAQGATVVEMVIPNLSTVQNYSSGSTNEFKHDVNEYLAKFVTDPDVPYETLAEIIAANDYEYPSRTSTYNARERVTEEQYQAWITQHNAEIANGESILTGAMDSYNVSAMIYPTTTGQYNAGANNRLSPYGGMPAVTVPMGMSSTAIDGSTIDGAPSNIEFLGRSYAEPTLLGFAYDYEQATKHRTSPVLFPELVG
ncbi:amidase family protein [Mycetocola zhujimingii]|nr:amidase family protein [Mycetocola zhujimingii]